MSDETSVASSGSADPSGPRLISLKSLTVEDLTQLQSQVDQELQFFVTSLQKLRGVQEKFKDTGDSVRGLQHPDNDVLVPLTTSMFVRGKMADIEKVLVDIGTGYYAEMTKEKAKDYFDRKQAYLENQIHSVQEVVREKQKAKSLIMDTLQMKMQQNMAQQQQAKT